MTTKHEYGWEKVLNETIEECKSIEEEESKEKIYTIVAYEDEPPTTREFMKYWRKDEFCKEMAVTVGLTGSQYNVDKNGLIVRVAPIDVSIQRIVPE